MVGGAAALFAVPLGSPAWFYQLLAVAVVASFLLGVTFAIPVGGADIVVNAIIDEFKRQ